MEESKEIMQTIEQIAVDQSARGKGFSIRLIYEKYRDGSFSFEECIDSCLRDLYACLEVTQDAYDAATSRNGSIKNN